MAATKYQLLYRYINEATNNLIQNSSQNKYKMTFEFVTAPTTHPFASEGDTTAEDKKEQMLSDENSALNPKTDMFFAYKGTEKVYGYTGYYDNKQEIKGYRKPYIVFDIYERIEGSPWMVNATYGSLEAALERAKVLVSMIGIENVKLIKVVPFDQFVRINHQV